MTLRPHDLVLASAGTGKTWQLTSRYLALVLRGDAPERILATTFTRKAAGEILARVLVRLCKATEGGDELATLRSEFPELELDTARCAHALSRVLRDVEKLRIGTLDSYFARVGRSYGLELGLPPGWGIVDDVEFAELQVDALAELLEQAPHEQVIELLRALQSDGAKRAVHAGLARTIADARELALESDAAAWGRLDAPPAPRDTEFAAARATIEGWKAPVTKSTGEPAKHWVRALDHARDAFANADWERLFANALVAKVADGETKYDKRDIEPALLAAIGVVLRKCAAELVPELARSARATRALVDRFEQHFGELRASRGALRFDDLPRALAAALAGGSALDLAFRLDGRVDHLLLDEFQDTSHLQWRCLEPLATEILAGDATRSFFCVGDVKQSIYGWRGADPELLAGLAARFPLLGEPRQLAESRRSSRVVLDLVNDVFTAIADNATFSGLHAARLASVQRWQSRYRTHAAARELPGAAVLLEARPAADDETNDDVLIELAAERAGTLHREEPNATIAVLLRRKKWIPRLIHALDVRGVRASGEGGNPLTDSAAVLQVLALVWLANHPEAGVAAQHVATSELGAALGVARGDRNAARERAAELARDLVVHGYGRTIAELAGRVRGAATFGGWDRARLAQLVELALEWDARATLRPGDFVRHVRERSVEDPSASRVKVMTVHASKGLEFDAVVLPELHDSMVKRAPQWLVERGGADDAITRVVRWPPETLARLVPELERAREVALGRELEGALSVLYVALTRAIHRVELVVPARSEDQRKRHAKSGLPLSFASIVTSALASDDDASTDDEHRRTPRTLWSSGDAARWFTRDHAAPTVAERAPREPLVFAAETTPPAGETRAPSAEEGGARRAAKSWLGATNAGAVARGDAVHARLAQVEWLGPKGLGAADVELARAFERPALRALLTRPDVKAGDELVAWRERRFAVELPGRAGQRELWQGAFDRVVLVRRGGKYVSAEIVDWKTDAVTPATLAERVKHYTPQLRAYVRVLAHMTGLAQTSIRAKLAFVTTGDVIVV